MKLIKNTVEEVKKIPKPILIAAAIIPGGLVLVGSWLFTSIVLQTISDGIKK